MKPSDNSESLESDNSESSESDNSERLESSIDVLEVWMIRFTVVVVVGLLIELVSPFQTFLGDHNWKKFVGESAGAFLVAIGVAGECLISFWSHRMGRSLRLRNAEKERRHIERLKAADVRIAEAEKTTVEARLETQKLKAQMAWRELTHEQTARLISELSAAPGSIVIERQDGDIESQRLSNQFVYVFTQAKWTVAWRCFRGGNLVATGLSLYLPLPRELTHPTADIPISEETRLQIIGAWEREKIPEAHRLRDVLNAIVGEIGFSVGDLAWGWSQSTHSTPLPPEPVLKLFVGAKPSPV